MKRFFLAIAAIVIAASLTACSALQQHETATKLVVQAATMKAIEAEPDRAAKAERIIAAADQARVWLDTDGVTLADLQGAVLARLALVDLEPSDRLLATALVDVVVAELHQRIGDGVISPEQRVTVNLFLGWVVQAAQFYSG